jgi:23S rRNA pseudouridine1911/1915/1917 synthase
MSDRLLQEFTVTAESANQTLAALLRSWLPGQTWSQVRKLVATRRVKINGELWLDDARRLKEGDTVVVLERGERQAPALDAVPIRFIDTHVVVVEKPAGIATVRHPSEYDWTPQRRAMVPTLDDLVLRQTGGAPGRRKQGPSARLRVVQRLDKQTSGLIVFARTVEAERGLGRQFKAHSIARRYLALVAGAVAAQTVRSNLVRDRGDGRRGSGRAADTGKEAVTHIEVAERLPGYTLVRCRLETGRTHQIRIHLAELGHPVCGDKVYRGKFGASPEPDTSAAPRLALHAAELGFIHPVTEEPLHWDMPLPPDLVTLLANLRAQAAG